MPTRLLEDSDFGRKKENDRDTIGVSSKVPGRSAPHRSRRPGRRHIDRLLEFDISRRVLYRDHRVFQVNQLVALHLEKAQPDFFGFEDVVVSNNC